SVTRLFSSFTAAQPPASWHQSRSSSSNARLKRSPAMSSNATPSAQQLCLVCVATPPPPSAQQLRPIRAHRLSRSHCLMKSHSSRSSATPLSLSQQLAALSHSLSLS
ncbi:hypothetical protein PanWU01x14_354000, partial [Parasponia andersonii]